MRRWDLDPEPELLIQCLSTFETCSLENGLEDRNTGRAPDYVIWRKKKKGNTQWKLEACKLKIFELFSGKKRDFLKIRSKEKRKKKNSYRLFQLILTSGRNMTLLICVQLGDWPGESGHPVPWLISMRTVWPAELIIKLILIVMWTRRGKWYLGTSGHSRTRYTGLCHSSRTPLL